ncbi:MAG: cobalamin biosynthesis protein CbiX [Opitutaceae bacterium]|jgi:sirohydrochlorin ferrochelatase|nr:cobalamin biosynthesis protein CbiX [Opitutaceae bacterium]
MTVAATAAPAISVRCPADVCFLFDNGSLRAEATRSLRALAGALERWIGVRVEAVSLLHSDGVPAEELDGEPARLLEPALGAFLQKKPAAHAVTLPLFFGPGGAVTDYWPDRLKLLLDRFPAARVTRARWLVDTDQPGGDAPEIVAILADRVRAVMRAKGLANPQVLLVDHGSPRREVTAVRNLLGAELAKTLAGECASASVAVGVASMARRDGDRYDFNEPLLERALRTPPFDRGDVVVALQFLSPGRHAGEGGDIATLCRVAEAEAAARAGGDGGGGGGGSGGGSRLRTHMTETISGDPRLVDVLARRVMAACGLGAPAR